MQVSEGAFDIFASSSALGSTSMYSISRGSHGKRCGDLGALFFSFLFFPFLSFLFFSFLCMSLLLFQLAKIIAGVYGNTRAHQSNNQYLDTFLLIRALMMTGDMTVT